MSSLLACVHGAAPGPRLPYTFEPRPTSGEVRVAPVFRLHDPVETDLQSLVGPRLPEGVEVLRATRARQLDGIAEQVGRALPGEVNGELGEAWSGQFRSHRLPTGWHQRVESALRHRRDLDTTLSEAARASGGDAVLFTWVDDLEVVPMTSVELEGTLVETVAGPVVVDGADEPYLVSATVGLALVAHDGEVVLRYHDAYDTVLSGARGPQTAARDLAHALAEEVAKVWATDPRLLEGPLAGRDGDDLHR